MMFIFPILIVAVLYLLYNSSDKFSDKKSPEDTLKERFINGVIDETTYLHMKETLKK